MANLGAQSNDDPISTTLNCFTSLDWWQAWGVWHGYDKDNHLVAVITDGQGAEAGGSDTARYGCIVREPVLTATGNIAEIVQFLKCKFPKEGE